MSRPNSLNTAYASYLSHRNPDPLITAVRHAALTQASRKCRYEVAEDIAQIVAHQIYVDLDSLTSSTKLSAYVHTITRRRIADHYATEPRTEELPSETAPDQHPDQIVDLSSLSAEESELILLREEGYSYTEISLRIGTPQSTIRKNVSRAKNKLRSCLKTGSKNGLYSRGTKEKPVKAGPSPTPASLSMGQSIIERNADDDPAVKPIVEAWRPQFRVTYCKVPDTHTTFTAE